MSGNPNRGLDWIFDAARRIMLANASLFVPPLLFPWLAAVWLVGVCLCFTLVVSLVDMGVLGWLAGGAVAFGGTAVALLLAGTYMAGWAEMTAQAAGTGRTAILDFVVGMGRHTWRMMAGIATLSVCLAGFVLLWCLGVYVGGRLPTLLFGSQAARLPLMALAAAFWSVSGLAFVFLASMWQPAAVVDRLAGRWAVARSFGFVCRHWATVLGILSASVVAHALITGLAALTRVPMVILALTAKRAVVADTAWFTVLLVLEVHFVVWAVVATFFKLAQFIAYMDLSEEPAPDELPATLVGQAAAPEMPAQAGA